MELLIEFLYRELDLNILLLIYNIITGLIFFLGFLFWIEGNIDHYTWIGTTMIWPLLIIKFFIRSMWKVLRK